LWYPAFEFPVSPEFTNWRLNEDGNFVGDGILFFLEQDSVDLVAMPSVVNWLQFRVQEGNYKVRMERDNNSNRRQGPPKLYRFELQGPHAAPLVEKLIGKSLPEVKFFGMTYLTIGGIRTRALRHGMAG
jgi:glycine cleavage system aminomethyltransferase T